MNSVGRTIQCLRKEKGVTQEKMAQQIGVTFQAISKWENGYTLPDIMLLPVIAEYFGVSIDDLFRYKRKTQTSREHLIGFMLQNGVLRVDDQAPDRPAEYAINTERFATGMQLNAIGEAFAEFLVAAHVEFEAILGLAYNGIGFAASTAVTLQNRYGVPARFCYDRLTEDEKGNTLCGCLPCDGDRIVIVSDVIGRGQNLDQRIDRILDTADVEIAAVLVIAETSADARARKRLEEKYHTKVYGMLNDEEIRGALYGAAMPL